MVTQSAHADETHLSLGRHYYPTARDYFLSLTEGARLIVHGWERQPLQPRDRRHTVVGPFASCQSSLSWRHVNCLGHDMQSTLSADILSTIFTDFHLSSALLWSIIYAYTNRYTLHTACWLGYKESLRLFWFALILDSAPLSTALKPVERNNIQVRYHS